MVQPPHDAEVPPAVLILFDIDATLLTTSRAGVYAMLDAGRDLHGEAFHIENMDFAGRLDPLIIADMLRLNGVEPDAARMAAFRERYGRRLEERLTASPVARALPGVLELLERLDPRAATGAVSLGLLTGNFPETGERKLRAALIEPERFTVRAWGCDSPHDPPAREHLPAVAMTRHREVHGREIRGEDITIIGDTPHDVSCALAHGCRVLGVGTGGFSADDLMGVGAHHAVDSLADVEAIEAWLINTTR
ncbi:MAG: hypothetical protein EA379_09885 [Phycisphaerales bacterium]|nr:MAG: hypothetical protein EA379_09885 [Phycisphaerales bacterium]